MAATYHVRDVEASLRWYTEVLDFTKWFHMNEGGMSAAGLKRGDGCLIIGKARPDETLNPRGTGLYFVMSRAELEEVHAAFKRRIPDLMAIVKQPWGDSTFYVNDPDGYSIEFATEE